MSADRRLVSWNGRAVAARALVLLVMAGFITAVYAVISYGGGALVGGSSLALAVVATALVAVAFESVRARVTTWANRLVHGTQATPYEALSEVTRRLTAVEREEGLFDRMAQLLVAATGATRATVWLTEAGGFTIASAAPDGGAAQHLSDAELPGEVVLIEDGPEVVGALTLETPHGDPLTATEHGLVTDLAGSASLVMRKLKLDDALAAKARELQESRRRLVDAQDAERRRLERDLHDGAQQQVVALKVKLGLAHRLAQREGSGRAAALIDQMTDDAQRAIDQIRSLARGIYPPLLQAEGLGAAVPALAALSPLDVVVEADVAGRHPLPFEGAVYFCISEALANAAKHATGPVTVHLSDHGRSLAFTVVDSGPGFDPTATARGVGLRNMADRLDALGGILDVTSAPGSVTSVSGELPVSP